jgi:DNA processing protein
MSASPVEMATLADVLTAETVLSCKPISPFREMAAYEALWVDKAASFKKIADRFRSCPGAIPSDLVPNDEIEAASAEVLERLTKAQAPKFGVRVHGSEDYPARLRDAAHPVELLYFRGWWDLIESPKRVAIVGARTASEDGIRRTRKLARLLVNAGYTIVSGLAKGVDTAAHTTAIEAGGNTIAVIGTPITDHYPPENKALQERIAEDYLLISQVPIWRYSQQDYRSNRLFFPERNATMSAVAQATIIVEASDTSGTLAQARAALQQGRKLFILDNCFKNSALTWPARFLAQGAIRVSSVDDIREALE